MVNFHADVSENPWLSRLDVAATNATLRDRARAVEQSVQNGEWARLTAAEKASRSPEVHQLEWQPIEEVVRVMQSSIAEDTFVNAWQRQQFELHGVQRRDPMSVTMASILELEQQVQDAQAQAKVVGHGTGLDLNRDLDELVEDAQFLFSATVHRELITGQEPSPTQVPTIQDTELQALPEHIRSQVHDLRAHAKI